MAYGSYKDLTRRIEFDKVLKDKAFKIASNPKHNGHERELVSMVYKLFYKKSAGSGIKFASSQQLVDELQKPIITKFKRCEFYFSFKDSIWGDDLADMQYTKDIRILLCIIVHFSKYAWVVPLKNKAGPNIVNVFPSILDGSERNQIKYGLIKVVNSIRSLLKNG